MCVWAIRTNHGPVGRGHDLLGTGRQLDTGLFGVRVVRDDGSVIAGSAGQATAVTGLLLDVTDLGSLGHDSDRENVAGLQDG